MAAAGVARAPAACSSAALNKSFRKEARAQSRVHCPFVQSKSSPLRHGGFRSEMLGNGLAAMQAQTRPVERPAVRAAGIRAVAEVVDRPSTQESPVDKQEGLMLYEDMVLGRTFEDMCAQMYYRGKMFGFVHLYNGQEAVSTGFIKYLRQDDYVCSTYRDHVHAVSKGVPSRQIMAELFGKSTGCCRGQGGSMHLFSKEWNMLGGFAFIAEGIPVATGAAFQTKYRKEAMGDETADQVTIAFFGDGTTNNGSFYECLNMAALWKLPILFVVENNLWAIGMNHYRATSVPEIWKKGEPFGMPGIHVDGMDVLKVREVAKEAIARARRGDGPTLVECETYRFRGHSLADPDELRDPEEKAKYAKRDPIKQLKNHMLEHGLAKEDDFVAIDKKIEEVIDEAVEFAEASPHPERTQLLQNVFPDPKGFGIGPDGEYRYKDPSFTAGTAAV
ncbi:Pyruvate dehydrogenase E1 alpha subunit [Klebsormidium nitens]|uniref:Pyruvate dehydrogenase E1 component subunit alpha n=1 Tax=Klebsormidium nitens TaxID=105231 RepID=A0A1Y1HXT0_KLENI|nr:Pyruvate dehydrogenase E1 alpha subunit [Klebsormidium nitens]|eukprot:GAQ81347.1 Pyruvate dehydrogenase E1 alpha subunit [Klebsormidium nitens]